MEEAKTMKSPMSSSIKLDKDEKGKSIDSTMYRGMIGKSRHLILQSQPCSQCLACEAKMLTTRKLKKLSRQLLENGSSYYSRKPLQVL
ncbi:hypothetical protein CK203_114657 [Vitis vinifera]|uniref:Uncharacterized protein n=1 Tax=Vitis vinifera TaxID=29760 RepID=A0A438CR74_VITVI|nr:hypothetical protein CK203_114657 [Vitis vinifera]